MELATIHRSIFTEGLPPQPAFNPCRTVEFTVIGIPWLGPNGGPELKHNEAFSFQIATDDQGKMDIAAIEAARRG